MKEQWCILCREPHEVKDFILGGITYHMMVCPKAPPGQLLMFNSEYLRTA